jgi:hypothetical protein
MLVIMTYTVPLCIYLLDKKVELPKEPSSTTKLYYDREALTS